MDGPFAFPNGRNTTIGPRANAVVSSMALCSGVMMNEAREVPGRGPRHWERAPRRRVTSCGALEPHVACARA